MDFSAWFVVSMIVVGVVIVVILVNYLLGATIDYKYVWKCAITQGEKKGRIVNVRIYEFDDKSIKYIGPLSGKTYEMTMELFLEGYEVLEKRKVKQDVVEDEKRTNGKCSNCGSPLNGHQICEYCYNQEAV